MVELSKEVIFADVSSHFSKEQLLDQLYSLDDTPSENVIEAYVRRLRKLVGPDTIKTRRGQGYLFDADSR